MQILRKTAGPAFKLIGNAAKCVFFAVHFVAPKLRFEIPKVAPPLLKGRSGGAIPRIVWQTNFSRRVALALYVNYLFNRLMAPTHEFRMLDDADIDQFMEGCDATTRQNYRKLQIGAAKADFWRLLAILRFGGTYMDVDATLDWPLELTLKDKSEVFIAYRDRSLTNYFFASAPANRHLHAVIDLVNRNIAENPINSVWHLTGPYVFETVLKDRPANIVERSGVCRQGTFTNEFFQYIDLPARKWHREQETVSVVKR